MATATLYEILEISSKASQDEIKKTYRRLAMRWHPDRNLENRAEAERRFKEIGHAYAVLSNAVKRAAYDTWLMGNREKPDESSQGFEEANAFDTFLAEILDLALELAIRGVDQISIYRSLVAEGCPESIAQTIAQRAHEMASKGKYSAGQPRGSGRDESFSSSRGNVGGSGGGNAGRNKSSGEPNRPKAPMAPFAAGPWSRWLARILDLTIGTLVSYPALVYLWKILLELKPTLGWGTPVAYILFSAPLPFIIDACIVGMFGNSLGKDLLRIRVLDKSDKQIGFADAVRRNAMVYLYGFWCGIPLLSLVPQVLAYLSLTEKGTTAWDLRGGYKVQRSPAGVVRAVVFVGCFFAVAMGIGFAKVLTNSQVDEPNIRPHAELTGATSVPSNPNPTVAPANATSQSKVAISEINGNIFVMRNGLKKQLTFLGKDRDAAFSPDKKTIVFAREYQAGDKTQLSARAIYLMSSNGTNQRQLAFVPASDAQQQMSTDTTDCTSPNFSPNGTFIFFQCRAGAVTDSLHSFDASTGVERTINMVRSYEVVNDGIYAGYLLAEMHKYWDQGGSYNWYWLLDPATGREVDLAGKTVEEAHAYLTRR